MVGLRKPSLTPPTLWVSFSLWEGYLLRGTHVHKNIGGVPHYCQCYKHEELLYLYTLHYMCFFIKLRPRALPFNLHSPRHMWLEKQYISQFEVPSQPYVRDTCALFKSVIWYIVNLANGCKEFCRFVVGLVEDTRQKDPVGSAWTTVHPLPLLNGCIFIITGVSRPYVYRQAVASGYARTVSAACL